MIRFGATLTAAAVLPAFRATEVRAERADRQADFIFRNGPIYTVNQALPWAEAVAVKGRAIVHVGDEAGALALAGPGTEVIDLNGRLLMPGFVEGACRKVFDVNPELGAAGRG